jgi:hypothetical protein
VPTTRVTQAALAALLAAAALAGSASAAPAHAGHKRLTAAHAGNSTIQAPDVAPPADVAHQPAAHRSVRRDGHRTGLGQPAGVGP